MKTLRKIIFIIAASVLVISCEKDDGDLHITGFETQLHNAVNAYRDSKGLSQLAHQYDIVSREAKAHAEGRAAGTISEMEVEADMEEHLHTINDKLGASNVSNESYISATIDSELTSETAEQLVALWAADPKGAAILEGDYTLSGPGEGKASDGTTYVMHIFCKYVEP